MSVRGSRVEYAAEAALEIALTNSVKVAAGSAASAANADSRSGRVCPDTVGSSKDVQAAGSERSCSNTVMPCSVSVTSVLTTVDRLTSGNNPNGVATLAGESASTE